MSLNLAALSSYAISQRLPQLDPAGPREYGNQWFNPGDAISLNPQPLPPKQRPTSISLGDAISLNPQPLPPRYLLQNSYVNPGRLIELNPQPFHHGPSDPGPLSLWEHSLVLISQAPTDFRWFTGPGTFPGSDRPPIF